MGPTMMLGSLMMMMMNIVLINDYDISDGDDADDTAIFDDYTMVAGKEWNFIVCNLDASLTLSVLV